MAERIRCGCPRCMMHGIKGPAVLITLGALFMLSQWKGELFSFRYTWPVLLIVFGLIKMAESLSPTEGHRTSDTQTPPGQGQ